MADPLADARLKLKRAHEHLQSTDSAFYWFNRDKPYRIVAEPNQEGTHKVVKVRFQGLSIERLAVISADAIHNMHSALDHLACALAARNKFSGDMRNIYFPIQQSERAFESPGSKGAIQAQFGLDVLEFLVELKPYQGGNDVLWAVNELDRIDKHQAIIKLKFAHQVTSVKEEGTGAFEVFLKPQWASADEDVEVARYPVDSNPEYRIQVISAVAFGHVDALNDTPIVLALITMFQMVEAVIIEATRRFFPDVFVGGTIIHVGQHNPGL
jgi:hypothetical protein